MEYIIGILIAIGVAAFAAQLGWDKDRSFYPTVMIVIAAYYVLFAAMGGSTKSVLIESAVGAGFSTLAVYGWKKNMMLVAAAIAGHGIFDLVHHLFIDNPGVPTWWPGFCSMADLGLGGCLAIRLITVR